uniref:Uncharacterized protein n=1 Tax=viral metagenome TaxID=1070528 RepID=A0A6C0F7Z7_9ZZZZ|tara:strand:- start:8502 stop:8777 length:276 start_codon:yes stop_codon:yes gene_type:complete
MVGMSTKKKAREIGKELVNRHEMNLVIKKINYNNDLFIPILVMNNLGLIVADDAKFEDDKLIYKGEILDIECDKDYDAFRVEYFDILYYQL